MSVDVLLYSSFGCLVELLPSEATLRPRVPSTSVAMYINDKPVYLYLSHVPIYMMVFLSSCTIVYDNELLCGCNTLH